MSDDFFGEVLLGTYGKNLAKELDTTWSKYPTLYPAKLDNVKKLGYMVYRNSEGKHKVVRQ